MIKWETSLRMGVLLFTVVCLGLEWLVVDIDQPQPHASIDELPSSIEAFSRQILCRLSGLYLTALERVARAFGGHY
jgi:hypothetical protein